jgi:ADP-L-glycero-D-manno-heptose 6-epimerase
MDKNASIIVTGAAGFIGSCLVGYLNEKGYNNLVIVDEFGDEEKKANYIRKKFTGQVEREQLFDWLKQNDPKIDFIFHLGARTDTTEFDYSVHEHLNVEYSKKIWNYSTEKNIPLVYASSAATYGRGEFGYDDDHDVVEKLVPLNPYGVSKNEFDKWAIKNASRFKLHAARTGDSAGANGSRMAASNEPRAAGSEPPFWAGLKFFNVYGPNEYHKGRMASVIFHAFRQATETGKVKLFRSHKGEFKDGEQLRDFIYVKDVIDVCFWLMQNFKNVPSGLYNVGTGQARTFRDLVTSIFKSLGKETNIEFIDTPEDIRDKYQYFTEANMSKLQRADYNRSFTSLEQGIEQYVKNYLISRKFY